MADASSVRVAALKSFELRFFCSIDMTGSTAFKYRHLPWDGQSVWPSVLESFLEDLPVEIHKAEGDNPSLKVWKTLGDEILFHAVLIQTNQVNELIQSVRTAIQAYSATLNQESDGALGLKATAWVAGFPITNRSAEIANLQDFVGPAIDLGFRLTKFATERKFVIDAGIAIMLSELAKNENWDHKDQCLFFDDTVNLKGIDDPYPVFWVDMKDEDEEAKEKLRREVRTPADWIDVNRFLERFYEKSKTILKPFIVDDDGGEVFGRVHPAILDARVAQMTENTEQGSYLEQREPNQTDESNKEVVAKFREAFRRNPPRPS